MERGKAVTLIAALARNRAIGFEGRMPWHLPAELKHFKATTLGKPVVMGRKTFESIGKALPGRQNIVVSEKPEFRARGCETAGSLHAAIERAAGGEIMVIGGGQLYRAAMPLASRMVLTIVNCAPEADTWFPGWDEEEWRAVSHRRFEADADHPYAFEIIDYRRR